MNINDIKKINFFIPNTKKVKTIHFIGIGGVGMVGIALILLKLGYQISGCDLSKNSITKTLIKLGVKIYFQHSEEHIKNIDLVIKSSAIKSKNEEIIAAKKFNIPVLLRAEMLQILMQFKIGIAISGTHGKTTATAMITDICIKSGLSPTCINGGLIKSINNYAILGSSNYFIVEADESDASFLYLNPIIAIVTNIELEHIEYYSNINNLKNTFLQFLQKIPIHGTAIICIDNIHLHNILSKIKCEIITYGFHHNADVRICDYKQSDFIGYFKLVTKKRKTLNITLNIPGKHNALNAAAAVAFAIKQNIQNQDIIFSLKYFQGTCRRLECLGYISIKHNNIKYKNIMCIDDYGHHPTEISETIKTIRTSWPKKHLIMIFQPHRYTRTYHLYNEFIKILSTVNVLLLLNVYSAKEKYITGADSFSLCKELNKKNTVDATLIVHHNVLLDILISKLHGDDILIIQGAGNVNKIVKKILFQNNQQILT
jgi:UDP-N-acetylmuramate--alanine ligase